MTAPMEYPWVAGVLVGDTWPGPNEPLFESPCDPDLTLRRLWQLCRAERSADSGSLTVDEAAIRCVDCFPHRGRDKQAVLAFYATLFRQWHCLGWGVMTEPNSFVFGTDAAPAPLDGYVVPMKTRLGQLGIYDLDLAIQEKGTQHKVADLFRRVPWGDNVTVFHSLDTALGQDFSLPNGTALQQSLLGLLKDFRSHVDRHSAQTLRTLWNSRNFISRTNIAMNVRPTGVSCGKRRTSGWPSGPRSMPTACWNCFVSSLPGLSNR